MYYQTRIRERMAILGLIGAAEPAAIEAWMRQEHPTLDHLTPAEFDREIEAALDCVRQADPGVTANLMAFL